MPEISYWLKLDQELVSFHNMRSFKKAFPENIHKELKLLVKQRHYIFRYSTISGAEEMMKDVLLLYEREKSQ